MPLPCFDQKPSGKAGKGLWPPSFSLGATFIYSSQDPWRATVHRVGQSWAWLKQLSRHAPAWEMNIGFSPLSPSAVIISWRVFVCVCVSLFFVCLFCFVLSSGFDKEERVVIRVAQTCQPSESLVVTLGERSQKALASTHNLSEWIVFFCCNCFALKNWRSYKRGSHLVILAIHLDLIWKLTTGTKRTLNLVPTLVLVLLLLLVVSRD